VPSIEGLLGIDVDRDDTFVHRRVRDGKVGSQGGLAGAALLLRHGNDFCRHPELQGEKIRLES
jgi:hypothetical protein